MSSGQVNPRLNCLDTIADGLFGANPKTAFELKNMPTVKHRMKMSWFGAALLQQGLASSTTVESTMSSLLYRRVLEEHVRPSIQELKPKRMWTMQHDNDPKHFSESTKEWLKRKKLRLFKNCQVKAQILILLRCCGVI